MLSLYADENNREGNNGGRTLTTQMQVPGGGLNMSVGACITACAAFAYAGVEFSQECCKSSPPFWSRVLMLSFQIDCGNAISNGGANGTVSDCNMQCTGNSSEFCGSGGHLDLYQVKPVSLSSTIASTPTSASSGSPSSSVATSTATSSSLTSRTSSSTSSSSLGPLSTGFAYYTYVDCHTDSVNARTLSEKSEVSYSITLEACASFCGGYIFFGVEFGRECYCGNSLLAGSTTATDGRCNMQCLGNSVQICGGGNGLSLYEYSAIINLSSSSSTTTIPSITTSGSTFLASSTTSSAPASTTTAPSGPSHVPSVGMYTWMGCYTDQIGNRALTALTQTNHATMTIEICASFCSSYAMFGVEYSM